MTNTIDIYEEGIRVVDDEGDWFALECEGHYWVMTKNNVIKVSPEAARAVCEWLGRKLDETP
jgi:hypothetical protein